MPEHRENTSKVPDAEQQIPVKVIPSKVTVHKPAAHKATTHNPRSRIYVRLVKGLHQKIRRYMNMVFMAAFMLTPWLNYEGKQAILFDIGNQKFNIFGLTMWPQDFTLVAWLFIIAAFALFAVTVFYGRVWCGYLCPQTVWTHIFMWFEEKLEGTRNQRIKLDKTPMNFNKFKRKTAKHTVWIAFSLLTALTFMAYFVPARSLFIDFFTLNASVLISVWVIFFTFCTYGNAGWMREIMCLHMCPYARFQSAMFDKDTFTVAYDTTRGETRGPRSRKQDHKAMGLGDCIDCNLCVQVCPTGIDIRNGLQYECINCGACIDACDGVMDKMGYDKGLISYTTEHNLNGKKTSVVRYKLLGYAVILGLMLTAFSYDLYTRKPLSFDIIRDRNQLYRENSEGMVENVYTLKILNKSQKDTQYKVSVSGISDFEYLGDEQVMVKAGEVYTLPVCITVDPYDLSNSITNIQFKIESVEQSPISVEETTRFFSGSR